MEFKDESTLDTDMIVFSAGIRPRDELARDSEIEVGPRGGIVINDNCITSDPDIMAIGECALYGGMIYGLVAPGNTMARVAAAYLTGDEEAAFTGADMSTKLKLMGVDVASFGDSHGRTEGSRSFRYCDEVNQVYKRIVVSEDGKYLLGGILIGDASSYDSLHQAMLNKVELPDNPEALILPASAGSEASPGGPESHPTAPPSAHVIMSPRVMWSKRSKPVTPTSPVSRAAPMPVPAAVAVLPWSLNYSIISSKPWAWKLTTHSVSTSAIPARSWNTSSESRASRAFKNCSTNTALVAAVLPVSLLLHQS